MKDLIERLERGERPYIIDIAKVLGLADNATAHRYISNVLAGSLDGALALANMVLPGWGWVMSTGSGSQNPAWVQAYPEPADEDIYRDAVEADTLPLALCIAILKAKESTNEQ